MFPAHLIVATLVTSAALHITPAAVLGVSAWVGWEQLVPQARHVHHAYFFAAILALKHRTRLFSITQPRTVLIRVFKRALLTTRIAGAICHFCMLQGGAVSGVRRGCQMHARAGPYKQALETRN